MEAPVALPFADMEVTARTLREVEFREKLRGYSQDEVDEFLERVAEGVELLHDRLRQAAEKANRAEQRASSEPHREATADDDTLRRTLVLAQRTADMAIKEANEQAAEILASAQNEARALMADAEETARRISTESSREVKAELGRLEEARSQLQTDVDALEQHFNEERTRIHEALARAIHWLEENIPSPGSPPLLHSVNVSSLTSSSLSLEAGRDPLEPGAYEGRDLEPPVGRQRSPEQPPRVTFDASNDSR